MEGVEAEKTTGWEMADWAPTMQSSYQGTDGADSISKAAKLGRYSV